MNFPLIIIEEMLCSSSPRRRIQVNYPQFIVVERKTRSNVILNLVDRSIVFFERIFLCSIFLDFTSSKIITFNSSAYIDYHYEEFLEYPIRLSLRFRTLGRISNGVLLSLTHRKSSSLMIPFIIIEHSNGKIEITILQLDERKILSTVTVSRENEHLNERNCLSSVRRNSFVHSSFSSSNISVRKTELIAFLIRIYASTNEKDFHRLISIWNNEFFFFVFADNSMWKKYQ